MKQRKKVKLFQLVKIKFISIQQIIIFGYKDYGSSYLFAVFWSIMINIFIWIIIAIFINNNK